MTDYTFLLTEFVIYITWNSSNFVAEIDWWKISAFLQTLSSLKKLEIIQTFKAQISCLGTSFFLRTDSAYDITWTI